MRKTIRRVYGYATSRRILARAPPTSPARGAKYPRHSMPTAAALARFVHAHPRLFVLTGAGLSTGSGIPGYRDSEGNWLRKPPVTHQDFTGREDVRKRYWARSLLGWPLFAAAAPNAGHAALAHLERAGVVAQLVTQNVDGLHQRAGSRNVIDLHGSLAEVTCLDCGARHARAAVQQSLLAANRAFARAGAPAAPDGDADVDADFAAFVTPACSRCGGMLKPDVVFHGDSVPKPRVAAAMEALDAADALVVVGSSLMVYSGFRFCERARATGKPIVAVNRGRTRADALLACMVEGDCAAALSTLAAGFAVPVGCGTTALAGCR